MKHSTKLMVVIFLSMAVNAWAAAPDLLPPLSMQVGAGTNVSAIGLDFVEHPKSGSINFSPSNYDVHLPGNVTLAVQDVVPYMGIKPPIENCKEVAQIIYDAAKPAFELITTVLNKILGLPLQIPKDPTALYDGMFKMCNALDANQKDALFSGTPFTRQNVADVRNTDAKSTNVIFSGEALSPYSGGFPLAPFAYGGTVVGDIANGSKDIWNDAVILASYEPIINSDLLAAPTLSSSLSLYRFLPNPAGNQSLQFVGYSSAWLDKPAKDNTTCFDTTDPQKPVLWPFATLVKNGCIGERNPIGIVSLNFFNHANPKMKDLVIVSRAPFGDPKSLASKVGYITLYKRNEGLPAPADTSIFQDIWQFEKSVTASTGIPEPYGVATVQNWDSSKNASYEGVVVGSNKLQGTRYYVYYFRDGMSEPKAILVGGTGPDLIGTDGFGPYRVYSTDVNRDRCGDILITRARISPDGKKIEFADYFDVHLQHKLATGECRETFDMKGSKYQIPAIDPKNPPQISAIAIANVDKAGGDDIVAVDFTIYLNKTSGVRENYVHFLEYKGGIYNTIQPPHFVVNTKTHGDDIGPIDIKADAYANLGVVTGKPMVFPEFVPTSTAPDVCKLEVNDPLYSSEICNNTCRVGSDTDQDGFWDIGPKSSVAVKMCENGNLVYKSMAIDSTPFTYSPDCKSNFTKTGRQWIIYWAKCDNCSTGQGDVCTGPEDQDPAKATCYNKSQADKDSDGYGDICKAGLVAPSGNCGILGKDINGDPTSIQYDNAWLDVEVVAGIKNDTDKDGIPDYAVNNGVIDQGQLCDNCSLYNQKQKDPASCKLTPSKCVNPDQIDSDADGIGDKCDNYPKDNTQSRLAPRNIPVAKARAQFREDKVIYADDQPVIANYNELKTVAVPAPVDNGHEVTVLLNKTIVKDTKKQCTDDTLACFCEINPDAPLCPCLKDPQAPECKAKLIAQATCTVDVCRGDLTAPFPRMCDYIRPYNDEIRKCTGLNSDFLIPVEGVQYHVSCTMPNTPALDLGNGLAYTRVYKTGQLPKNYFKDWHKPVADDNVLTRPVLLNPPAKAADGTDLDISILPNPSFSADPLLSVVPNATLNQAPGIAQIDGVMEIQTNLIDMAGVAGAGKALPGAPAKVLSLDVKGFSSPAGCQWGGDDCPRPMPNPPSAREFVNAICAKAKEAEAAGKAVTVDTVNEAFNAMNVGPAFLHQKLVIPGAQGAVVIPMQNTMGNLSAEGGCGCTITATSTMHNTALPLLMALSALGGMAFLRRNTAKKR